MASARRPSPQTTAVILALAGEAAAWSHGYQLCRTLELKAGTIYPILRRLAERGLVETAWERDAPPGRPPRHLYRLSPAGAEFAIGLRVPPVGTGRSPVARRASRPALGTAGA